MPRRSNVRHADASSKFLAVAPDFSAAVLLEVADALLLLVTCDDEDVDDDEEETAPVAEVKEPAAEVD